MQPWQNHASPLPIWDGLKKTDGLLTWTLPLYYNEIVYILNYLCCMLMILMDPIMDPIHGFVKKHSLCQLSAQSVQIVKIKFYYMYNVGLNRVIAVVWTLSKGDRPV